MTPTKSAPQALGFIVRTKATVEIPFQTILTERQALEIAKHWGDPEDGISYSQAEIEEAIAAHFEYEASELAGAALSTAWVVGRPNDLFLLTWHTGEAEFDSEGVEVQTITRSTELG